MGEQNEHRKDSSSTADIQDDFILEKVLVLNNSVHV